MHNSHNKQCFFAITPEGVSIVQLPSIEAPAISDELFAAGLQHIYEQPYYASIVQDGKGDQGKEKIVPPPEETYY